MLPHLGLHLSEATNFTIPKSCFPEVRIMHTSSPAGLEFRTILTVRLYTIPWADTPTFIRWQVRACSDNLSGFAGKREKGREFDKNQRTKEKTTKPITPHKKL